MALSAMGLTSTSLLAADNCFLQTADSFHQTYRTRDFEAVQEFVNSKRTIPLEEKDCNLSIAGDVRFEWAHIIERVNGLQLRGVDDGVARQNEITGVVTATNGFTPQSGLPFSTSDFAVEFNLYFDYVCDRAWAVAWLDFYNPAGIDGVNKLTTVDPQGLFGSGCCRDLCLRKAYIGYNIFADGCSRFDIELGRRPLYTIFDSRVQFQNRFDGLLLKFNRQIECWGDFYWNLGAFVVDERVNYFSWVTEVGMLNIYDCGFDLKYSFIDWKSILHRNRAFVDNPFGSNFQISQWTVAYNFTPDYICVPSKLYGAFLWNHAARSPRGRIPGATTNDRENKAWYVGLIIGEVCHEGDWALDLNYQVVQAQAIPGTDVSGIGSKGANLLGDTLYANGRDFTNYRGWRFEGLYALTDNLSLDTIFEFFQQDSKNIGGTHSYSKFELQAIYAF
jgi:hypothetical protein